MEEFEVKSTSKHSAVGSDIPIRLSEQVRLVFRPEIVDNPHDAAACIRGTFIYQRKGKNDVWADPPAVSLNTIKKGDGYKLELKAGELLPLMRQLSAMYSMARKEGVPQGKQKYVRLEKNLAEFLAMSQTELGEFLAAHQTDALSTLHKVLHWLANSTALADFIGAKGDEISVLNAMLGVAGLRTVLGIWEANKGNSDEEFWQQTLANHAFVISQVFSYPILVIAKKAYVGGKRLDNKHGNLADFLATAKATGSSLIIEINTPATLLLAKEYRGGVYPPSFELAGGISQVLEYRETLSAELSHLQHGSVAPVLGAEPRCLVIAGSASAELASDAKRRSFERFRERMMGVTVITYDELFERVRTLEELLTAPGSGVA